MGARAGCLASARASARGPGDRQLRGRPRCAPRRNRSQDSARGSRAPGSGPGGNRGARCGASVPHLWKAAEMSEIIAIRRSRLAAYAVAGALAAAVAGYGIAQLTANEAEPSAASNRKILYWYDPMIPAERHDGPGLSS